jgi:ATP-binding cassette, subfamily B (MDR/TAP), member 1
VDSQEHAHNVHLSADAAPGSPAPAAPEDPITLRDLLLRFTTIRCVCMPAALRAIRFADLGVCTCAEDKIVMLIGAVCSVCVGGIFPIMTVIFGDMIDVFLRFAATVYSDTQNTTMLVGLEPLTRSQFDDKVREFSLWFVYLGIGSWCVCWGMNFFWMWSAERKARRIRTLYVKSLLSQEQAWYDVHRVNELTARIAADSNLVQDAVGEKFGQGIQHMSSFIGGFIIGFARSPKLTGVLISIFPVMAGSAGLVAKVMASYTGKSQQAYGQAGGIAEEVRSRNTPRRCPPIYFLSLTVTHQHHL